MKRLLIIMALMSVINVYSQNLYDNGWQKGYQEGYCYQDYGCISPIPPISPLPLVGESYNDYKAGYQRGFLAGRQARQNVNSSSNQSGYYKKPRELAPIIQPDTEYMLKLIEMAEQQRGANEARTQQVYDYNLGLINQAVANFNNKINQLPENVFNSYSSNARTMANELNALMDKTNILDGNSVRYLLNRVNSYIKAMDNWEFLTSLGTGSTSNPTSTNRKQSTTNKPDAYIGKQIYLYNNAQLYHTPTESGKIDKYTGGLVHVVEKVNNTLYYKVLYNNRYYYVSNAYLKPLTGNNENQPVKSQTTPTVESGMYGAIENNIIRSEPTYNAPEVGKTGKSIYVVSGLFNNNYYKVRLPNNGVGYVSKAWILNKID